MPAPTNEGTDAIKNPQSMPEDGTAHTDRSDVQDGGGEFVPPTIRELGNVGELTLGSGSGSAS